MRAAVHPKILSSLLYLEKINARFVRVESWYSWGVNKRIISAANTRLYIFFLEFETVINIFCFQKSTKVVFEEMGFLISVHLIKGF